MGKIKEASGKFEYQLGGVFKVSVTKKLILLVKHLHAKYQVDLEAKIKLVEQEVACKWQIKQMGNIEKLIQQKVWNQFRDPFEEK